MSAQTSINEWAVVEPSLDEESSGSDCHHDDVWLEGGVCMRCNDARARDPYDGQLEATGGRSTRNVGGGR